MRACWTFTRHTHPQLPCFRWPAVPHCLHQMWWIGEKLYLAFVSRIFTLYRAQVLGHAAAGNSGLLKLHQKWHQSLPAHTALLGTELSPVGFMHVKWANGKLSFVKSHLAMVTSMDFARSWQAKVLSTPCDDRSNCSRWSLISLRLAKPIKAPVCLLYARSSQMYTSSKWEF